jgi:indolepyruvate ferredoxin oxidoreductase beta subunit
MTETNGTTNLLIVGVGGQGVITLSDIVVRTALRAAFDVKQSEIHGMSQRGGSVSSHIRIGRRIHSPVIDIGTAGIVVALERLEALRHVHFLAPDGLLIVDDLAIPPMPVSTGTMEYPDDVLVRCRERAARMEVYRGTDLAQEIGTSRMLNTCFAGVLSRHMRIDEAIWSETIRERFATRKPEANLEAFALGRKAKPIDTEKRGQLFMSEGSP